MRYIDRQGNCLNTGDPWYLDGQTPKEALAPDIITSYLDSLL